MLGLSALLLLTNVPAVIPAIVRIPMLPRI